MGKMKCTVLIPTYNRPNQLKRLLSYYHQYGNGLPVLIADSSSEVNKKLNRETVASFQSTSFLYFDKYDPSTNFYQKMLDVLQQVSTEYCVICADDDFVTPSGIQEAVAFLDINPDFTIAHGHYLGFQLVIGLGGKPKFYWFQWYRYKSITHLEPKDRLSYFLSNPSVSSTTYAVWHTNFKKMVFAEVIRSTSDYWFAESLHDLLVFIYGKMKYLDVLYSGRDSMSGHTVPGSILDFIKDGSYKKKYLKFSNCLANHLSKQSKISLAESQKIVDTAVSACMEKRYPYRTDKIITTGIVMSRINQKVYQLNLPNRLASPSRRLYHRYKYLFRSPPENEYDFPSKTIDIPPSKYYHDFNQIRSQVLSSAREKQLME